MSLSGRRASQLRFPHALQTSEKLPVTSCPQSAQNRCGGRRASSRPIARAASSQNNPNITAAIAQPNSWNPLTDSGRNHSHSAKPIRPDAIRDRLPNRCHAVRMALDLTSPQAGLCW
jgi:hypothetical protein